MDTTLTPDDHPIILTPNNPTTDERALREELDRCRARHGLPCPDLAGDLDLLENSRLGEHAQARRLNGFDRTTTGHHLPPMPELPTFAVTVSGKERHYGEPGSTCLVHVGDFHGAETPVTERFIATVTNDVDTATGERYDPGAIVVEGPWDTLDGAPTWPADRPGRAWTDMRREPDLLGRAFRTWSAR